MTSMSRNDGGLAYARYCAVAHTSGRPVVVSSAATHAASPHPPKRKFATVLIPGVTGSTQRWGLWVGRRPRKSRTSTGPL